MLGAVAGPLIATLLIWGGLAFRTVILWTLVPGLLAAGCMFFVVKERTTPTASPNDQATVQAGKQFPRVFWLFLIGVFFFGLGDFSRTFLIWLAAHGLGETGLQTAGTLSIAALLYTLHNLVSATAAYPVGSLGDRRSKMPILVAGYGLGVLTNGMLAVFGGSMACLSVAIVLSGIYIAVEETLEKAVAAELLPRELRSLGFGVLACTNAVGDMASSLYVGFLLEKQHAGLAFGLAATLGAVGVVWMLGLLVHARSRSAH